MCRYARRAAALVAACLGTAPAYAVVSGTWEHYGTDTIIPGGRLKAMVYNPARTAMFISFTKRFDGDAASQVWGGTFPGETFAPLNTTGFDGEQPLWSGLGMTAAGQPIMVVGDKGPVYRYDGANWQQASLPAGETIPWYAGATTQIMSDGGIVLLSRYNVLRSTDDGLTFTNFSNTIPFTRTPAPLGASDYPTRPAYLSNAPDYATYGYNFVFEQMPWGELIIGGESDGFYHSLDGGATWEHVDPRLDQPQRNAAGIPWYQNRRYVAGPGGNLINAAWNKNGEVVLGSDRNGNVPIYRLTPSNVVMPMSNGLGNEVTGASSKMVMTPNGELFFWTGYQPGTAPPGHSPNDVFAWDGTTWTTITPLFGQGFISTALLGTDGTNALIASGPGIMKFVSANTVAVPKVSLGAAVTVIYPNAASLGATVDLAGPWTYQWTARQSERVRFWDASGATTQAWFTSPGDYVVNCQAINGIVRGGNSVIVHVLPTPGAVAPSIATQPANALLVPGGTATFTVAASVSSTGPLSYQWFKDGVSMAGATSATLSFTAAAGDDGAAYACLVSGPGGRVLSNSGTLGNPPVIVRGPADQSAVSGAVVGFSVSASGTGPLQWQWYRNGVAQSGIPAQQCAFSAVVPPSTPGVRYSVRVTNLFGSVTSDDAVMTVSSATTQAFRALSPANDSSGPYNPGTQVPISAPLINPSTGGFFSGWQQSGGGTVANPTSATTWFTLPSTVGSTIFVAPTYAAAPSVVLTAVNGTGTGIYAPLEFVPISALPAPPGYLFDHWQVGSSTAVTNPAAASTSARVSTGEGRVTAIYTLAPSGLGADWKSF